MVYTITDPHKVVAGDRVFYGSLGYFHDGIARDTDGDGEKIDGLQVNRGGQWFPDFIRAEREQTMSDWAENLRHLMTPLTIEMNEKLYQADLDHEAEEEFAATLEGIA
jgi:hypothetical protein